MDRTAAAVQTCSLPHSRWREGSRSGRGRRARRWGDGSSVLEQHPLPPHTRAPSRRREAQRRCRAPCTTLPSHTPRALLATSSPLPPVVPRRTVSCVNLEMSRARASAEAFHICLAEAPKSKPESIYESRPSPHITLGQRVHLGREREPKFCKARPCPHTVAVPIRKPPTHDTLISHSLPNSLPNSSRTHYPPITQLITHSSPSPSPCSFPKLKPRTTSRSPMPHPSAPPPPPPPPHAH